MRIASIDDVENLKFTAHRTPSGLIPVVAQHALTGEVLMVAWSNREAVVRTMAQRELWFYSRSRSELWRKGETSGNVLRVVSLHADCDRDSLLALVIPAGPACHTGSRSCFDTSPTLTSLDDTIIQRIDERKEGSHTSRLLSDANLRHKKLGEEAVELALACAGCDTDAVAEEAADLLYHMLVACRGAGVTLVDVLAVLERRSR